MINPDLQRRVEVYKEIKSRVVRERGFSGETVGFKATLPGGWEYQVLIGSYRSRDSVLLFKTPYDDFPEPVGPCPDSRQEALARCKRKILTEMLNQCSLNSEGQLVLRKPIKYDVLRFPAYAFG